ncbi:MAG: branched-chain amino acid ABC transporter permease [Clostridia bacterium]|nr:branched-chain amino acid ABC transporter permease [Clostridia bacterium]
MKTKSKRAVKPGTKQSFITYGILIALFAAANIYMEVATKTRTFKGLLVTLCAYAILAVSLNLTVGFLGELSLGQAGFMYIGAFSSALFSTRIDESIPEIVRFPLALVLGGIIAAIFGILIGIPVLRLKGDYLAIVTLAFGEIIKNVLGAIYIGKDADGLHLAIKASEFSLAADGEVWVNGPNGINNIPRDSNFTIAFILLFVTVVIAYNFSNSRTGRAFMSIRDNRIAAESVGLNITKYKLITFGLTAFLAGVAGALYAHDLSSLQPQKFDYNLSILFLVFVVLGGIGSIRGSVIAAIILHCLPELILRDLSEYRMLIYAVILIAMMLFRSNSKIASNVDKFKGLFFKKDKAKKGEVQ